MLTEAFVTALAHSVASIVSLRRELVRYTLTDDECEKAGQPYESTARAVFLFDQQRPLWHCRVYLRHELAPEGCVDLRVLGWRAEVWYLRKVRTEYRTAL